MKHDNRKTYLLLPIVFLSILAPLLLISFLDYRYTKKEFTQFAY